ncbi:putative WD40 repeat-like protein [Lyophyllum shimeji]|uniref:WD40 repeat-like protein n=1 Tax=Lyophyllum shimeji TaxID=47721 RepID=A0A9P3PK48_LYOSH|nr:putative WD40 repeat-like protein [Lyophyllum shimeji]
MAKHPRKKQKTSKEVKEIQPLGSSFLTDDAAKDDEERRLESILFGTKFVPRDKNTLTNGVDNDKIEADLGGNVFNNLMDSDLFFVDDGAIPPDASLDDEQPSEDEASAPEGDDSEAGSDDDSASSSSQPSPRIQPTPPNPSLKTRKPPAWTDTSDPPAVSLSAPRLRKLRDAPSEETLSGREYEARLRRQYERINPEPAWAAKARKEREKENLAVDAEGGIGDLLASTEGIVMKRQRRNAVLPAGTLELERLRDANLAAQASGCGEVKVVAFHPSERVPVLCVGSADRRVRLFNVDGHTNPLLQTLHVPSLPLTSQSSVSFHPLGAALLLTGPRPFFYTHDLQRGVTTRHARGLWGTTFNTLNDTSSRKRSRSDKGGGGGGGEGMEVTAFSPGTGSMLAVAGRGGYVHLVDWASGAGQVVGSLKCGAGGGGARALWWASERELAVLSGDAEVYLWDVGERRCVRRWKDEGGFRGAGRVMAGVGGNMEGDAEGRGKGFLAVGSNTGFVNVYGADAFTLPPPSSTLGSPKPLKSIANLTTAISSIRFNHDAQLMAIASQEKKDAMRLIHMPSLTSFSNWPTSSTPLGHVTAVDFSARSEYVAIGNTRGRVLLYHLKDYGVGS